MSPDHRRSLLITTLGFAFLEPAAAELRLLHSWLSTWTGIGHVIIGMHRQGYDVQLTQYDDLRHRDGALSHECDGVFVGADAVGSSAAGGVAGIGPGHLLDAKLSGIPRLRCNAGHALQEGR